MPATDSAKISAVRKVMENNKIDGLIVSNYIDLKYLLGDIFLDGEAILLIHPKGLFVTARSLYLAPVKTAYPQIDIIACDSQRAASIVEAAKKFKLKNVAFDCKKEPYCDGKLYAANGFKEIFALIDALRMAKTDEEIKIMKQAAKIAYSAYEHLRKFLKAGITEKQAAAELERFMKEKGASALSFDTIVAFGKGGANPHYATGNVKLKNESPVLLDFGCIYKGYCSDITRSFWFGKKPVAEYKKILDIAIKAHDEVVKKANKNMTGAEIDNIARQYIAAAGYGDYFTHGTGHGIGMQIHEDAYINQNNQTVKIAPNFCFSVEPGIYLTGKFGVRWEDCFYMTDKGIKIIA